MKQLLLSLSLALSVSGLWAQQSNPAPALLGTVDTTWPGIQFQVLKVQRTPGNRLLFFIVVYAKLEAPPAGTFIGLKVAAAKQVLSKNGPLGHFDPFQIMPFSIENSTITDEATKQTYSAVKLPPLGIPASTLCTLHPDESTLMTVQFPSPPPIGPTTSVDPKQTVSILLPSARGPITKIVIPPPAPPAPATAPAATR